MAVMCSTGTCTAVFVCLAISDSHLATVIGPLLNGPTKWDRSGAGALFEGVVKMVCVIVLSAVMGEYLSEDMGSACVGAFVRVCGTPVKFGQ